MLFPIWFVPDVVCSADQAQWEGLGPGHGRITARRLCVDVSGRRVDRPRRSQVWFPGPDGTLEPVAAAVSDGGTAGDVRRLGSVAAMPGSRRAAVG